MSDRLMHIAAAVPKSLLFVGSPGKPLRLLEYGHCIADTADLSYTPVWNCVQSWHML